MKNVMQKKLILFLEINIEKHMRALNNEKWNAKKLILFLETNIKRHSMRVFVLFAF